MSLHEKVREHDKKYSSGNFYKFEEGQNQVRILTEPARYDDLYEGDPVGKFVTYAIVRHPQDGDIPAVLNLPMSIIRKLDDLEIAGKITNYPMPFDLLIMKETPKKGAVKYMAIMLEPNQSVALTDSQIEGIKKLKPIDELAEMLQKKKFEKEGKTSPTPVQIESPADTVARTNRSKAEMDPMFTAFEAKISKAEDLNTLERIGGQISSFVEDKTLPDFEADLLRDIMLAKRSAMSGVKAEDINVDDIQF